MPVRLKREVEDALARHAADNGIAVASGKFRALALQDICPSLRLVNAARWSAVRPEMICTAEQPAMKALSTHLQDFKKKRKQIEQMIDDLAAAEEDEEEEAAADDGSQSSPGSAEEGEEEEAQADESDNEQAVPKPTYAEGNPHELRNDASLQGQAPKAAEVEEGADAESAKTAPAVTQVLEKI